MIKSSPFKILCVDDDNDILALLSYNLVREGYDVALAGDGEQALDLVASFKPDLILLDLMMPRRNGLELTRILRSENSTAHIPIIMLTAKGEESDIIIGLELGADDYVVKPFSLRIVLARVKALLRRREPEEPGKSDPAGLTIDTERFEARMDGVPISLTATEFRLLHLLSSRRSRVVTRSQIVDVTRGEDYAVTDRSVDVHIVSLRKKLGIFGNQIETVRGVGYRMKG